jgi:hypothetical protein
VPVVKKVLLARGFNPLFYFGKVGFHDQGYGGRLENHDLKGCLTENLLLQVESITLDMFKNVFR